MTEGFDAPPVRRLLPIEIAALVGLFLLLATALLEPAHWVFSALASLLTILVMLLLAAFGIWFALTRSGHWSTRLREALAVPLALVTAFLAFGPLALQARIWHADAHLSRHEPEWEATATHSLAPAVAFPYRNGMLGGDHSIVFDRTGRLSRAGELPPLGPYHGVPMRCDRIRGSWYLCVFD